MNNFITILTATLILALVGCDETGVVSPVDTSTEFELTSKQIDTLDARGCTVSQSMDFDTFQELNPEVVVVSGDTLRYDLTMCGVVDIQSSSSITSSSSEDTKPSSSSEDTKPSSSSEDTKPSSSSEDIQPSSSSEDVIELRKLSEFLYPDSNDASMYDNRDEKHDYRITKYGGLTNGDYAILSNHVLEIERYDVITERGGYWVEFSLFGNSSIGRTDTELDSITIVFGVFAGDTLDTEVEFRVNDTEFVSLKTRLKAPVLENSNPLYAITVALSDMVDKSGHTAHDIISVDDGFDKFNIRFTESDPNKSFIRIKLFQVFAH